MYDETQQRLIADGVPETVRLYRGVSFDLGDEPAWTHDGIVDVGTNAMSSWSVDGTTARNFAYGGKGKRGFVLMMDVPRSRILSTARTGFGCLPEGEFVVLGNNADTAKVSFRQGD